MAETQPSPGLRSGEIARRAGVSADTLRHYERRGLLGKPQRLANGYRAYPPETLDRVLLIQRALGVGFTLDELAELLGARDRGHPPCQEVRSLAEQKLRDVDRQLEDLAEFRKALLGILLDWDVRLASADGKMPARLLESLTSKAEGSFIAHAGVRLRPSPQTKGPIMRRVLPTLLIAVASLGASAALAQDCHHAKVAERGDHVMGFDHAKTKHHFLLSPAGGSIEASANDPADTESREAIRGHLEHIASMFSEGNFDAPMLIHDQVPPGVPTMKRKKALIAWKFEETEAGGRVRITSKDAEALAAIHEFLRFQIEDHQTGDPTEIPGSPSTANRKN